MIPEKVLIIVIKRKLKKKTGTVKLYIPGKINMEVINRAKHRK